MPSQLAVPWCLKEVFLDLVHDLFQCSVDCFVSFDFWETQGSNVKTMEVLILFIKFEPLIYKPTIES